jgi:hypothetical protein
MHSSSPIHAACPAHDHSNYAWWRVKFFEAPHTVFQPPITSSLSWPNILLTTLFSNTLSVRSSLNISDQVLHPYKSTGKTIVLHTLIFMILDSRP